MANGAPTNGLNTPKLLMILVNFLTLTLVSIISWWALNAGTRQSELQNQQIRTDLLVQELRTWRETSRRQDEDDHALLMRLSVEFTARSTTLESTVALIRDLKTLIDVISTQQIAQRESLMRIEDAMIRTSTLQSRKK